MNQLNAEIDGLSSARSLPELAARTQRIMKVMVYYISQSEAAILDTREEHHALSTQELQAAAGLVPNPYPRAERPKTRRPSKRRAPSNGKRRSPSSGGSRSSGSDSRRSHGGRSRDPHM